MEIDAHTAILTYVSALLGMTIIIGITWLRNFDQPGLGRWAVAMASMTSGMLLYSLQGSTPLYLIIIAGNLLTFTGGVLFVRGTHAFLNKPVKLPLDLMIFVIIMAGIIFFSYINPSYRGRVVLTSFGGAVLLMMPARLLIENMNKQNWLRYAMLAVPFGAVATLGFGVGVFALFTDPGSSLMQAKTIILFFFIVLILLFGIWTLGVIWSVTVRASRTPPAPVTGTVLLKALVLMSAVVVLLVLSTAFVNINYAYREMKNSSNEGVKILLDGKYEIIRQDISNIDQWIKYIGLELKDANLNKSEILSHINSVLNSFAISRTVIVADNKGNIISDSRPGQPALGRNITDRKYFSVHTKSDGEDLYIGPNVRSRVDGHLSLPLSGAVRDDQKRLIYVWSMAIDPVEWARSLALRSQLKGTKLWITDKDGIILLSSPFMETHIGAQLTGVLGIRKGENLPKAANLQQVVLNGENYSVGKYSPSVWPVHIYAAASNTKYMAAFWTSLINIALITLISIASIIVISIFLYRQTKSLILQSSVVQENEQKYRGIFDESVAAIYVFDTNKFFTDANQAGLNLLGYTKNELLGMHIFNVDADPTAVQPEHRQLLSGENIINFEHRLLRKDGRIVTVLNNSRPLSGPGGEVIGMQSTLIDITERKKAEMALRKSNTDLEDVQRMAHLGNWIWDIKANKVTWSKEVYRIFERDEDQFTPTYQGFLDQVHCDDIEKVTEAINLALDGVPYNINHRILLPDGKQRYVYGRGEVTFDEAGEPLRMTGSIHDITDLKLIEKDLINSEEHFRGLINALPDLVFLLDEDGNYLETYATNEDLLVEGWDHKKEFKNISDFFSGETHREIIGSLKGALKTGELRSYRYELDVRAGRLWFEERIIATNIRKNGKRCLIAVSRDITRRYKVEQALLRAKERIRAILDNTTDLITVISSDGVILFQSPASEQILGYRSDELIGRNCLEFFHADDVEKMQGIISDLIKRPGGQILAEYRFHHKDGGYRNLSSIGKNALLNPGVEGIIVSSRDVTKQRLMQQAVQHSEELLTTAIEAIDVGFVLYDSNDCFVTCNAKYREIYAESADLFVVGSRFEDVIRTGVERGQFIVPDGRNEQWVSERMRQHTDCNREFEQQMQNGRWVRVSERRLPDGGIVGFRVDITALKLAEKKARNAQDRFHDFALIASDWFWETGPDTCYTYISRITGNMGIKQSDFIGKSRLDWIRKFNDPSVVEKLESDMQAQRAFKDFEYLFKKDNGEHIYTQISGKPLFDEQGSFLGYRGIGRDITREKRIEKERRHDHKMKALGRMAGGIAHDFNNTLQPIALLSSAMVKDLEKGSPAHKKISIIQDAVTQLAILTKNIRQFSRKDESLKININAHDIVKESIDLATYALPENVSLISNLDEDTDEIFANAAEIQSVVLNLISNSVDSYGEDGGDINISLSRWLPDDDDGSAQAFIKLEVSDQGAGILNENLPNIFEPFYTTKSAGRGTGLGLSSVYGIVVGNHGGRIEVKSEPGVGTIFEIYFPISKENTYIHAGSRKR